MEVVKLTPYVIEVAPRQGYKVMATDIHPSLLDNKIPVYQQCFFDVFGEPKQCHTIPIDFKNRHISEVKEKALYFVKAALDMAQEKEKLLYLYYIDFVEVGDSVRVMVRGA